MYLLLKIVEGKYFTISVAILVVKSVSFIFWGFQFRFGEQFYVLWVELIEIEVAPHPVDQTNDKHSQSDPQQAGQEQRTRGESPCMF